MKKPERIWISDLGINDLKKGMDVVQVSVIEDVWMRHEYIRADLLTDPEFLESVGLMVKPRRCIYYGDCEYNHMDCQEDDGWFKCPDRTTKAVLNEE